MGRGTLVLLAQDGRRSTRWSPSWRHSLEGDTTATPAGVTGGAGVATMAGPPSFAAATVLVTGAAGFIGACRLRALLARGSRWSASTISTITTTRSSSAATASPRAPGSTCALDFADKPAFDALFAEVQPHAVIHLGAQAGVLFPLQNPYAYPYSNLGRFQRDSPARRCSTWWRPPVLGNGSAIAAVLGRPGGQPATVTLYTRGLQGLERADGAPYAHPVPDQIYRACASSPCTAPGADPTWPRCCFSRAILAGQLQVFNDGQMRDFTYMTTSSPACWSGAGASAAGRRHAAALRRVNLGNHRPVPLEPLRRRDPSAPRANRRSRSTSRMQPGMPTSARSGVRRPRLPARHRHHRRGPAARGRLAPRPSATSSQPLRR